MNCTYCRNTAVYKCSICGAHTKETVVCPSCMTKSETKHTVKEVSSKRDKNEIRDLVKQFWGKKNS